MSLGKTEFVHWHSGMESRSTPTPGSTRVEIHSSRMDASRGVMDDGDSIFIVFCGFARILRVRKSELRVQR